MARKLISRTFVNDSSGEGLYTAIGDINDNFEKIFAGVEEVDFADPLELDASLNKDFYCGEITDDTTINLNDPEEGDAGMIEIIIDDTGGYTVDLGAMFTKNSGGGTIDTTAGADNVIAWMAMHGKILYSISQIS